ncbi:MAG: nucleoside triphosphate pyrophosphohydrolase [Aphanocapsa sp. GSE-SYN-MK-11-07L]|nr:nucleoside triphosphate pyrophosphohydrolase [Aphanocapsa sp. GSE-SYN-MK-11-07L]
MARRLVKHLQQYFPADHQITLIHFGETEARDTAIAVTDFDQADLAYPLSLYLNPPISPPLNALQELIDVVAQLRSPQGGCPWDLAQTPLSLTPYVIEEAYEVVDAIRQGEPTAIAEELGDLLLQVVLQAQIASEDGQFSLQEIAAGISSKLIRRHPHVFGDLQVESIDQVRANWEQIKAQERGESPDQPPPLSQKLSRYLRTLPPIISSLKIAEKAGDAGLDWPNIAGVWDKFYEELAEFKVALAESDRNHQQSELGDLLFSVINLARWCQLDPELALQGTCQRFIQRLEKIEAAIDQPLDRYSLEELEAFWQQAKVQLKKAEINLVHEDETQAPENVAQKDQELEGPTQ